MSTEIQWTDETWNPVTGCTKVSPGCALFESAFGVPGAVVTAYKLPRPPLFVVSGERVATPASTNNDRIRFAWLATAVRKAWTVLQRMVTTRRNDLDVVRPVVCFDSVQVVRDFAWTQGPTDLLLSDEPVLVDVSADISEMVSRQLYQDVPVGCDRATAFPIRVSRAGVNDTHALRVARFVGVNPDVS